MYYVIYILLFISFLFFIKNLLYLLYYIFNALQCWWKLKLIVSITFLLIASQPVNNIDLTKVIEQVNSVAGHCEIHKSPEVKSNVFINATAEPLDSWDVISVHKL